MSEDTDNTPPSINKLALLKKASLIILLIVIIGSVIMLVKSYYAQPRVIEISNTAGLDARGGEIRITYSEPIFYPMFKQGLARVTTPDGTGLFSSVKYQSKLNKDRTVEIISFLKPTPYNLEMVIVRNEVKPESFVEKLGIILVPEKLSVSTGIEQVAIAGTVPAQGSNPAPETLDNQLVLRFKGEVRGKFKTRVNIPAKELASIVQLTPKVKGYYQWSDDSTLTFNFSEDKPHFETTYRFEVFPENLVDDSFQTWAGDQTTAEITTSTYEVYVADVSAGESIEWSEKLRIEFSGNMVGALDVLKIKDPSVVPIEISPVVKGLWRWVNARTIEFTPDSDIGWPTRQTVSVTVHSDINLEEERRWRKKQAHSKFSFMVKPRQQSISAYSLHGKNVDLEKELVVTFSRDIVNQTLVGTRFNNHSSQQELPLLFKPAIKGRFIWIAPDKIQFTPQNLWSELQEYVVALNPDYNPDDRYEWTGSKKFKFKTIENLVTASFYFTPENKLAPADFFSRKSAYQPTSIIPTEKRLWVSFSKELARQLPEGFDLSKAINIHPETSGAFKWLSASLLEFVPDDNWLQETGYQITLTKKLLQHPQAHYPEGNERLQFKTDKNAVIYRFDSLKKNKNENYVFRPDKSLTILFNKNVKTQAKVGKIYHSKTTKKHLLPFVMTPEDAFNFEWNTQRELKVTPMGYWQPSTQYQLTLKDELLPQKQAHYAQGSAVNLETEKNILRINRFKPQGETGLSPVLEVTFNKNIMPIDVKLKSIDSAKMLSISPALKGDWVWQAKNQLQFVPEESLQTSTRYTVSFDPNKISDPQFSWHQPASKPGASLALWKKSFQSKALHVKQVSARFEFDEKNLLKQRFFLDMEMSAAVTAENLRRHFTIWYKKNVNNQIIKVPLTYKITTDDSQSAAGVRAFSVVSDWLDRPAVDRQIYYQLTRGLKPVVGNLDMALDYQSDFRQEKPRYIGINSIKWQWKDGFYNARMTLSAPVEPEKIKQYLLVRRTTDNKTANDKSVNNKSAKEKTVNNKLTYLLNVESSGSRNRGFSYLVSAKFIPGQTYSFDINEGLLAADGAFTHQKITTTSQTPDLNRRLDFALSGQVLSKNDLAKVPVLSANLEEFEISVNQIFDNNVDYFLNNKEGYRAHSTRELARNIHKKRYKVNSLHTEGFNNRELVSHIDLSRLFKANQYGLFQIVLSSRHCCGAKDRWFLSTDIGLVGRQFGNQVLVWANSLKDLSAKTNAKIEVVDRWNQVIASGYTNSQGVAELELPKGSKASIIRATSGDDFSFLHVNKHTQRFVGYDTSGISSSQTHLRSYIYSDRGVYRPGDTAHLVSVTRGRDGKLPIKQPVKFVVTGPTGQERLAERFQLQPDGTYIYDFEIPAEAKTGKWEAKLLWDERVVGQYQFQVEEFIPNKIKVKLTNQTEQAKPGRLLKFDVQANNLFGPPAAGRKVSAQVSLRPSYFKPEGFSAFSFGHDDTRFQRIDTELLETRLDKNGHYQYEYLLPEGINSPIGLEAHYNATVIDDGGRGVSNYARLNIQLFDRYLGLRRLNHSPVEINDKVAFELVNVDPQGNVILHEKQKIKVSLYHHKKVTHYRKNERGYYRYVTEKQRSLIKVLDDPRNEQGQFSFKPQLSGEYIVEAEDLAGGQLTRFYLNVRGPLSSTAIAMAADKVDLKVMSAPSSDASIDSPLKLEIRTPFKGKLLLTGERDKVIFKRIITMNQLRKVIEIPVRAEHFPNFYITAAIIKPVSQGGRKDPIYASGLLNVKVIDPVQIPTITLNAPERASPGGKLAVDISVAGSGHKKMYVTLAAVDVGILDLTRFKTPDMSGYFNDKRRLEVAHLSLYPSIMPYEPDVKVNIDPSGDAPSRALVKKTRVNPDAQKRVKSVALWSGLLAFDEKGEVTTELDIPDFDGALRLMAVVFGDQRFGSVEQEVLVRDKLVAKPTLPRFLATGDDFNLPVKLFNATGKQGEVSISLKASEQVQLRGPASHKVHLDLEGEASTQFSLVVNHRRGLARFELIVEGLGEVTRKIINVPVRTPGTFLLEGNAGSVDKQTPETIAWPDNFVPGSEELSLEITSNPLGRFQNSLDYLLRYPHGCLEQTTSKLLPLIYFSELAKGMKQYFNASQSPRYFMQQGIKKLERMQLEDGQFAYWEGTSQVNQWAFIYASHFMVEAKKAGLKVNTNTWNNMIYRLNQNVRNSLNANQLNNRNYGISHQLYGLYVLALANENILAEVNFVYDKYRHQLKSHQVARLAATFHLSGQKTRALNLLNEIKSFGEYDDPYRDTGGSFASGVRDLAMLLDAFVAINPESTQVPLLLQRLSSKAKNGRWGTTQDNAYAFLAIGKALSKGSKTTTGKVKVTLGDGRQVPFSSHLKFTTSELLAGDVDIEVEGNGEVQYSWQASGISNNPEIEQQDAQLKVRRRYLDKNGKPVNLNNLYQGQLVVAEIRVQSLNGRVENIAIEDLLPGGLEIENARLSTSASLPWIKSTIKPDYVDIRDDRISLFVNVGTSEGVYFYTTRAVTVGNFKVPAIRAEAMYDPSRYSIASDAKLKILSAEDK